MSSSSASTSSKRRKPTAQASSATNSNRFVFSEWEFQEDGSNKWELLPKEAETLLEESFEKGDDDGASYVDVTGQSHSVEKIELANCGLAEDIVDGSKAGLIRRNEIPTIIKLDEFEWEFEKPRNKWHRLRANDRQKLELARIDNKAEVYLHLHTGSYVCNLQNMTLSQPHIRRSATLKLRRSVCKSRSTNPATLGALALNATSSGALTTKPGTSHIAKQKPNISATKQRFGKWILPYKPKATSTEPPTCVICQEDIEGSDAVTLKCRTKCVSAFHEDCILPWLDHKSECPICKQILGELRGDSPPGRMTWRTFPGVVAGFGNCGVIEITYDIPDGVQGPKHPHPGMRFTGTYRHAYLPNVPEGLKVLGLLKRAFDAGLTFTVGTSLTTGATNTVVWSGLHHKSNISGGPFGYPDPTYLQRIQEELKYKGIEAGAGDEDAEMAEEEEGDDDDEEDEDDDDEEDEDDDEDDDDDE